MSHDPETRGSQPLPSASGEFDRPDTPASDSERRLVNAALAQFLAAQRTDRPRREVAFTDSATSASGQRFFSQTTSFFVPGYRILSEIHRGGQGIVYQALQESTRRKVAIKVLKEGPLADRTELARFDREVDVLSRLRHPHIVAIYDRGLAAGHAYYVMDYIPGRPLDAHVAGSELSTDDVLALFVQVCDAVNVAHLRGVIHRDLKPGNIRIDEEGAPRILDFGLAKLMHDVAGGSSAQANTLTGQFVGSLPWASPEQASGQSDDLDIRTDVYSLGVILYQLLTGRFPYPVVGRMNDVVRHIVHTSPARLSTDRRPLDRDLELIVMMALAKEPERRYQSAGDLARDIRRFIAHEPVLATSPNAAYRLRKFVRRHRGAVSAMGAVFLSMVVATALSLGFGFSEARQRLAAERALTRAEKAEGEARARADDLERVTSFQEGQLSTIDVRTMGARLREGLLEKARAAADRAQLPPNEIDGRVSELESLIAGSDFTGLALESLNENFFRPALSIIERRFGNQPLLKARLLQASADSLYGLGLLDAAAIVQQEALDLRRNSLGVEHADTLDSISQMGELFRARGRLAEARPYLAEAVQTGQRVLGENHPKTLFAVHNYGLLLRDEGKLSEAEQHLRDVVQRRRRTLGDLHPDTLISITKLGGLYQSQGRLPDAESLLREALDTRRRTLGDDHPSTLNSLNEMALLLQELGKLDEAEPLYREALDKHRIVLGDNHPDTLASIDNMGFLLQARGKLAEAEPYHREALEKSRRVLGDEHPATLTSINNFSMLLLAQNKFPEAETLCREALDKRRRILGDDHPHTVLSIANMALLLQEHGKLDEAEPLHREALQANRRLLGDDHPQTLISMTNMGTLLKALGKPAEAESYLREALDGFRRTLGDDHFNTLATIANLSAVLQMQAKSKAVIELLTAAEPAARSAFAGDNASRLALFLTVLGRARQSVGEFDAASTNLIEAQSIFEKTEHVTDAERSDMLNGLVEFFEAWDAADPGKGHDREVTEWRTRFNAWRSTTQPASIP